MNENFEALADKSDVSVKVFFEISRLSPGKYVTYDEGDYETEVYVEGNWTRSIVVETFLAKDIDKAFEKEDGDYDWNCNILYITDLKDKILFDRHHYKVARPYQFYDYHDELHRPAKELYDKIESLNDSYKKDFDRYTTECKNHIKRIGGYFDNDAVVEEVLGWQ